MWWPRLVGGGVASLPSEIYSFLFCLLPLTASSYISSYFSKFLYWLAAKRSQHPDIVLQVLNKSWFVSHLVCTFTHTFPPALPGAIGVFTRCWFETGGKKKKKWWMRTEFWSESWTCACWLCFSCCDVSKWLLIDSLPVLWKTIGPLFQMSFFS